MSLLVEAAFGGYIKFTADDRFDVFVDRLFIKLNRPIQGSVIGYSQGALAVIFGAGNQLFDF